MSVASRVLGSLYERVRGIPLDPEVPQDALVGLAAERAVDALRGLVRGRRYRSSGTPHFRSRGVTVRYPRLLTVGRNVVLGERVTVEAFSRSGIQLADGVTVARGASLLASGVIRHPGEGIAVGENASIGANNIIWGQGGVTIGRDCLLGPNVTIVSENHIADDRTVPVRLQGERRGPVTIGDDVWLGAGVTVLAGIEIGRGAIVAAGAVVTKAVPEFGIAAGVPAKVVGFRGDPE